MARKRRIKIPLKTLTALVDGLRGIFDIFYFREYTSNSEGDSDNYCYEISYTEPEEVSVALAEFASELIRNDLIKKGKEAPSFADIFEQLFGSDHELTAKALYFENLVSEYEGYIPIDDMREAQQLIDSMISELSLDAKEKGDQSGELF